MRFLYRVLLTAILILFLVGLAVFLFLDRGARAAVETGVSYALDVPCSVSSVSIHPFGGSVGLSELSIANPAGFSDKPMLELRAGSMRLSVPSLMEDMIEVPSLELSGIHLRLEGRGTKTNYGVILDNLARFGSAKKPAEGPAGEEQGPQKRFLVRELVIRAMTVEADYSFDSRLAKLGSSGAAVSVPEIRVADLGNGKSLTLAELSIKIFEALLKAAASGNVPGFSAELAKDLTKNLSGYAGSAAELGKGVEDALKGVKGLLKKN